MGKNSFILHKDSLCILDKLTNEQAGVFIKAIYTYQTTGKLPKNIDLLTEVVLTPFINQFLRDEESYENVVERNRGNGLKGGRPKKNEETQKTQKNPLGKNKPKKADSDSDSVNDSENENDLNAGDKIASKTNTLFARPNLQEVIDYFKDKGYKEETARQAFNHYEAADWKLGDTPIHNWKQKMVRWFTDNNRAVYVPPKTERPIMPPAYNPADWKP